MWRGARDEHLHVERPDAGASRATSFPDFASTARGLTVTRTASPEAELLHQWLSEHRTELLDELIGWARLRSVVGPPEHDIDLRRSAQWLAGELRDTGFPTVEVWPTQGGPAVYAEWCSVADAPTVLVYSHHDVRAAKDEEWEQCPPFEPALREGRLFGRGTSDAKGQVLAHIWAVRAILAAGAPHPPVNLKVLVEGEEEVGSPNLADLLQTHRDRLDADLIVLSDTMIWRADVPAVCLGIRGLVQAQVEILGPLTDFHGGVVAGVAPNPATELVRVLGRLHRDDGTIAIDGFYDDVRDSPADELAELSRLPSEDWVERTCSRSAGGEDGRLLVERLWLRPSVEVIALVAGDSEGPSRGTIPSVASAHIQFWIVPDQDPQAVSERIRSWIASMVSDRFAFRVTIQEELNQPPYSTPRGHPAVPVLAEAMSDAFGTPAQHMRNGGGAPAALLAGQLDLPVLFFGTGLPEDRWHDSEESINIDVLMSGVVTMALFWQRWRTSAEAAPPPCSDGR